MNLTLKFKLQLSTDYHIGAGHGTGAGIDSALLRDADGVPVIRGTTLSGLFRDGLWQLLSTQPMEGYQRCQNSGIKNGSEYCGQFSGQTEDACPICRLFGTPQVPKRWRVHSARPQGLSFPLRRFQVEPAVSHRASINPRSRRAEPHKLFSQEEGSGTLCFEFDIICQENDPTALDEAALWVAAARNVRQLGRSRNRGQGECLITITDVVGWPQPKDEASAGWQTILLQRFADQWLVSSPTITNKPKQRYQPVTAQGGPVRVRFIVRADEPLLVARRAEAGNQFESLAYIPGQTVRGALAWQSAEAWDLKDDPDAKAAFVRIFLRQDILFSNLYPAEFPNEAMALYPVIPAPRDLFECKVAPGTVGQGGRGSGHGVHYLTHGALTECNAPGCESPLEAIRQPVVLSSHAWQTNHFKHNIQRGSEMHIRVRPDTRRVQEDALFGYVALDAGQYFIGDFYCRTEAAWLTLQKLSSIQPNHEFTLHLGKANRRGYGRVTARLEVIPEAGLWLDSWRYSGINQRISPGDTEIQLMLLSDTIIQDSWGRYATGFDPTWIRRELGIDVAELNGTAVAINIDGFNGHIHLPRWRDVGLTAGSTVHITLKSPVDLAILEKLEREGIGLRRGEGFGQVAFNHPVYHACEGIQVGIPLDRKLHLSSSEAESRVAFRRVWLDTMDREALKWSRCKEPLFTGVARWLLAHQNEEPNSLASILVAEGQVEEHANKLGYPSKALRDRISDYGERHKDSKLQDKGKEGLKLIQDLLKELQQKEQSFWPLGISMLADRIAAAVQKDKE